MVVEPADPDGLCPSTSSSTRRRDDLALVVAGHPPPLLVQDGRTRFVTEDGSPVHGLGEVPRVSARLPVRSPVTCSCSTPTASSNDVARASTSDSRRLQAAADELLTAVDDLTDLDDVLAELAESVSDPDRHDDVAVLAFRRVEC